ncbi:MAG: CTP synthase [Elusimicrobia bacterium CG08_land_8_20_14_0_20_51_18]|nr:MAG: CTP synthase [Elusimicrobia bacterium CG08_land_8_20_14_0_20_51_18]
MTKYIFITGGVVSSLGKGITSASVGRLLKSHGFTVNIMKCDPYINVDAGTMSPFQHGEVFVTDDGAETDLDLGYYERFIEINASRANNITAGQIYQSVIEKERKGLYLGQTVQTIPHVTDEIKARFHKASQNFDITIVEIGGTVGDIESLPFLEAARQMKLNKNSSDIIYIHVTLVPYLSSSDELKTKPTQHSVNKLREIGIDPDIIVTRSEKSLSRELRDKIALFCSVPQEAVVEAPDAKSIYEVPEIFKKQGIDEQIMMLLRLRSKKWDFDEWNEFTARVKNAEKFEKVKIAMAGKYTKLKDSYKSLNEALFHASIANEVKTEIEYVDTENLLPERIKGCDGLIVPGGFGDRGIEGKIRAIQLARENGIPFFGICLGMQCAAIEFARNVLNLKGAHSAEFAPKTAHPVIALMEEQKKNPQKGGTMRLGSYPCSVKAGTLARRIYGSALIDERHRHRYEFNNAYIKNFEKKGMRISGLNRKNGLVEILELKNHPFYIAVQFHPEFKSRPLKPHPLFLNFVKACRERIYSHETA